MYIRKTHEKSRIPNRECIRKECMEVSGALCHICPITLSPMTWAMVLDQKHAFDFHAIFRHFITQAIGKGRTHNEWTNPLTNCPVRDMWMPPPVVQKWLHIAGNANLTRMDYKPVVRIIGGYPRIGVMAEGINLPKPPVVLSTGSSQDRQDCKRYTVHWNINSVLLLRSLSRCVIMGGSHPSKRYYIARELLCGIPLYYSGPFESHNSRNTQPTSPESNVSKPKEGELIMADGSVLQGSFMNGRLEGSGCLSGPDGVFRLQSDAFCKGLVNGSFAMDYYDRQVSRMGTLYRGVGHTTRKFDSLFTKQCMGAFRVIVPSNPMPDVRPAPQDGENISIYNAFIDSVWSEQSTDELRFTPFSNTDTDGKTIALFSIPPDENNSPIPGELVVSMTHFDPEHLQTYRYTWRGPVQCVIGYNYFIDTKSAKYPSVDFRVASDSEPADDQDPSRPITAGELKITPDPPSGAVTQDVLQSRLKELFAQANRMATGFLWACSDHVWFGYSVEHEYVKTAVAEEKASVQPLSEEKFPEIVCEQPIEIP